MVRIFLRPNLHKVKNQSSKTYSESTLFPILSIEDLLPEIEKNLYLNKIQAIVRLPDDYFKIIYEELIDNFALFVQILPEAYGEELGGLLNESLRRAMLSIQILHENYETTPHPLLVFAVFSIALLSDMGEVLKYRVMISDEEGAFIDDWYPLLGFMSLFGDYFKLRPYEETSQSLIAGVTPVLARQLLSETAITWLSSNNQIFDMWLAFLHKGEDWAGGLGKILKIDAKQFEERKKTFSLLPIDAPISEPVETDLGEKFLAWLKNGLEDGSIHYNEADSLVHLVKTDEFEMSVFLQAPQLFQQFCNLYHYAKARDWIVVCKQFNHLGLTKLSGGDLTFEKLFSASPDAKSDKLGFLSSDKASKQGISQRKGAQSGTLSNVAKEGIIVKDAKMLFSGGKTFVASQYLKGAPRAADSVLPKIRELVSPGGRPAKPTFK